MVLSFFFRQTVIDGFPVRQILHPSDVILSKVITWLTMDQTQYDEGKISYRMNVQTIVIFMNLDHKKNLFMNHKKNHKENF